MLSGSDIDGRPGEDFLEEAEEKGEDGSLHQSKSNYLRTDPWIDGDGPPVGTAPRHPNRARSVYW